MKVRRLSLFFLVIFALTLPFAATGQTALDDIVERGELRVGMSGNQPPFNVKSKSGSLIGYEVDLANVLAATMGVKAKLVTKPFADLLPALERGEVDIVMSGMTITPERNLKVAFVGPYMVSGKSILTKSKTLAAIDEAGDIDGSQYTLTALRGSTSQKFVETLMPKAKLETADDYDAGVQMVLNDEADALVADMPICLLSVLRYPDAGLTTLTEPLTIEPIGIAVKPNDSLLLNFLENTLGALEIRGLFEALDEKWLKDGSWLIQVP